MKWIIASLGFLLIVAIAPANAQEIKERLTFQGPKGDIAHVAVSPDGKTLAIAGTDKSLTLWDADAGKLLSTLKSHDAAVVSLAFAADGKLLATGHADKQVRLWQVPSGGAVPAGGMGELGPLAVRADGSVVQVYSVRGTEGEGAEEINWVEARLLDLRTGARRTLVRAATPLALPGIGANLRPLAFSADGKLLAVETIGPGGNVEVIIADTATGKQRRLPMDLNTLVAFSTDGSTLAMTAQLDLRVKTARPLFFWNLATGTQRARDNGVPGLVALAADMRTLVAIDAKGSVKIAETTTGALELRLRSRRAIYLLQLGDKSAEEFRRPLLELLKKYPQGVIPREHEGELPAGSAVDLVAEIHNISDREVDIWIDGDFAAPPGVGVQGPGVLSLLVKPPVGGLLPEKFRPKSTRVRLAPGASHARPLTSLRPPYSLGQRYWTLPGDYTLTASWALAAAADKWGGPTLSSSPLTVKVAEARASAGRLKGLKAALADIEKGMLKQLVIPPPAPPWYDAYMRLLKQECGIEFVHVNTNADAMQHGEMAGYNELMLLEIEQRYGQGILGRLGQQAQDDYYKGKARGQ